MRHPVLVTLGGVAALVAGSYWVDTHQGFAETDSHQAVPWDQATSMTYAQACAPAGDEGLPPGVGLVPGASEIDALGRALDAIGASAVHTYAVMAGGRVYNLPCDQPPPEGTGAGWYSYTPGE